MMKNISKIDFKKIETGLPSFIIIIIIIIIIAMTFSNSTGLAFGFLAYTLIKVFQGKWSEIKPGLWVIDLLCVGFFII